MNDPVWPAIPPKRILLATDFSSRSDRALDRAAQLARQWGAQLLVVHAIEQETNAAIWPDASQLPAWHQSPDRAAVITRMVKHDIGGEDLDVRTHVEVGNPVAMILKLAARERCDLIVMGMARDALFGQMLLGNAAEQIVRESPVSVLVVKSRPRCAYRHVLVGTDFTGESRLALRTSTSLFPEANFVVMHAFERPYRVPLPDNQGSDEYAAMEMASMNQFVTESGLSAELSERLHTQVEYGTPGAVLSRYVVEHNADLAVIGAFNRGLVFHLMIGGTARRIVDAVPTDVLVVRASRDA